MQHILVAPNIRYLFVSYKLFEIFNIRANSNVHFSLGVTIRKCVYTLFYENDPFKIVENGQCHRKHMKFTLNTSVLFEVELCN